MATVTAGGDVTAAHYRPLRRLGGILILLSAGVLGGLVAIDATDVAVPFLLTGTLGLVMFVLASSFIEGYKVRTKQAVRDTAIASQPQEVDLASLTKVAAPPDDQGHLYVIQFSSGTIKVGRTNQPVERMKKHRRYGWAFGVVIVRAWISGAHEGYEATETALIDYAAATATGDRARREFFHGADFDALVAFAEKLASGNEVTAP